jgi:DNA helicase-2/ATP-dependent DNA helicase PcrA
VAITRAKQRVFISSAELRTIFGSTNHTLVSRFLKDIPEELIERHGPVSPRQITWAEADITRSAAAQRILSEALGEEAPYQVGDRVRHETFGDGMVVRVAGASADLIVSVAFPRAGIKKLDPQHTRLEKL